MRPVRSPVVGPNSIGRSSTSRPPSIAERSHQPGGEAPATVAGRKRAVARAVQEVSHYLGNTPAVCRASYIDPRVIDLYDAGITIRKDLDLLGADASYGEPAFQGAIESAVLRLLRDAPETALQKAG